MALSEQEQRALREIEQSLLAEDPQFGSAVADSSQLGGGGVISLRGIALIVVGLAVMVGGIALAQQNLWFAALSVIGFLIMFGSGIWMLKARPQAALSAGSARATSGRGRSSQSSHQVTNRLEENFRRRFEENQ